MPHGKRVRDVVLSSVKKQTKEQKRNQVENVRSFINDYADIYVLYYQNESSKALDTLRKIVHDSKFSFASNSILKLAVGRDEESTLQPRTYLLSKLIVRKCCLMFTNLKTADVKELLQQATQHAYIHGGQVAPRTVVIPAGHLDKQLYAGSLEPELRRLGLPTRLDNEVILVTEDYTICREGEDVNGAQAALLRHFGHQLGSFIIEPAACWLKEDQDILLLKDECAEMLD